MNSDQENAEEGLRRLLLCNMENYPAGARTLEDGKPHAAWSVDTRQVVSLD